MLTLADHLRFRYAFSPRRREALKNAGLIAGLLAVFAITGTLDYQDALLAEAEAQTAAAHARYARQQAAMLACLNGGSPGYYTLTEDGHRVYLVCEIHEVSDENTQRKRS